MPGGGGGGEGGPAASRPFARMLADRSRHVAATRTGGIILKSKRPGLPVDSVDCRVPSM